jgi:hypothetical protein
MLATITYSVSELSHTEITSALDEVDEERYKFETTISDQIGSDSSIDSLIASQEAAQNTGQTPQEEMKQKIDELNDVVVPVTDEIMQPAAAELLAPAAITGTTEHTGGTEGAIDRLAWEIGNQLREKKTLVVWLFDVSPSLKERREVVANRVETIYKQLTQLNTDSDKALKTAVASFSERATIITDEPVDTAEDVVKAVRGIKSEESGRENVFSAVQTVINKFLPHRTKQKRAMMVIIVTDEAGSDPDRLEQTIQLARRYGIKCYCVGDASGRRDSLYIGKRRDRRGRHDARPGKLLPRTAATRLLAVGRHRADFVRLRALWTDSLVCRNQRAVLPQQRNGRQAEGSAAHAELLARLSPHSHDRRGHQGQRGETRADGTGDRTELQQCPAVPVFAVGFPGRHR